MKKRAREKLGSTCAACGREAETIDHIVAHAKGLTEVVNLQPALRAVQQRPQGE